MQKGYLKRKLGEDEENSFVAVEFHKKHRISQFLSNEEEEQLVNGMYFVKFGSEEDNPATPTDYFLSPRLFSVFYR